MSEILKSLEAINSNTGQPKARRILAGLGRYARVIAADSPAPTMGHGSVRAREALSFFDVDAPVDSPRTAELDRLDAPYDEAMIADKMSHIEIRKTDAE